MLERLIGAAFRRVILPIGKGLAGIGLSANAVTVIGFLITVGAAYVIATGNHFLACVALLGGAMFDSLDGVVARVTNTGSKRGAFLDSTLDRLSDAVMFVGIMWRFAVGPEAAWVVTADGFTDRIVGNSSAPWGVALSLAALILAFMVSYVRARAEGLGFEAKVGVAERPERVVLVAFGLLIDQLLWLLVVLVILSAVTLAWRIVHVWKQSKPA